MNNQEFLKSFRRLLTPLDTTTRDNIVREIESLTVDTDAGGATLEQRFGHPQDLATQYLDGVDLAPSVAERAGKFGRRFLIGLGCLTFAAIIAGIVLNGLFNRDQFDYANEDAIELKQTTASWADLDVSSEASEISIEMDQAKVVLYWHGENQIRWKCESDEGLAYTDSKLAIRHDNCLVYLPLAVSRIMARQGQIILVRPQKDVQISLRQAELKLAEKGNEYQYDIGNKNSEIAQFTSVDSAATTIRIDAVESSVSPYSF